MIQGAFDGEETGSFFVFSFAVWLCKRRGLMAIMLHHLHDPNLTSNSLMRYVHIWISSCLTLSSVNMSSFRALRI